jgi:NADPH2:quinone reductase
MGVVAVRAFGLNRFEQHFRQGLSFRGSSPRMPGIEAVGLVAAAPGVEFPIGAQVAALMGGTGREFDGGYAGSTCTCVPATQVPLTSDLPWEVLGAYPRCCRPRPDQSAWASPGPARSKPAGPRCDLLSDAVRAPVPRGVDGAVELVGTDVLRDTLRSVRAGGTVCSTRTLSDTWTIAEFYPLDWSPDGVRLTAHCGDAADLRTDVPQVYLDAVSAGTAQDPLGRTYTMTEIVQGHHDLDDGRLGGKGVVLTSETQR